MVDQHGKEVVGSMHIMIDATVSVNYDSKVKVKKLGGQAYPLPNKEWQVKNLGTAHLLGPALHKELWV